MRARSPHVYRRAKARYESMIGLFVRTSDIQPLTGPTSFSFRFYERDKKRDPDGFCSAGVKWILDALVTSKILPDDGWKWVSGIALSWEVAEKPGVLVTMHQAKEEK